MLDFIHITDLHILPAGETNYGLDPAERLRVAVESIALRHGPGSATPAEFVIVTGDLTHHGQPEAYAQLRTILEGLPMPFHLMLGNHDEREHFRAAFPEQGFDPDGFVQQVIETDAGLFVLLDTKTAGTHAGALCEKRLAWLAARLAESEGPLFLFLHHPPMPVGISQMDRIQLVNPADLAAVLAPHQPRIRHMFHGHLHRPLAGSWRGIPFSSIRGTAHQVALDLSERETAPGSHEPAAYALVRVTEDAVIVHSHDYLDQTGSFDL
jgi:3',5'-cyclic AMP phosphodiesterase CpdA